MAVLELTCSGAFAKNYLVPYTLKTIWKPPSPSILRVKCTIERSISSNTLSCCLP